ncbi:MAG: hypothetical protein KDA32_08600 [Phycisphaerales bacterium]|nr:hypothetical protein [Phycisphaerales bacterium]
MSELVISPKLVGSEVRVASRPEWGVGRVLRVQEMKVGGQTVFRVGVQFHVGHKTLQSPPAVLSLPTDEPQRETGWLDTLGGSSLDDKLRALPEDVADVLGSLRARLQAVVPLYEIRDEPADLLKWARRQTGVADPLSHWSRDELSVAFRAFCIERDSHCRNLAAQLRIKEGHDAVREFVDQQTDAARMAIREALGRVI